MYNMISEETIIRKMDIMAMKAFIACFTKDRQIGSNRGIASVRQGVVQSKFIPHLPHKVHL